MTMMLLGSGKPSSTPAFDPLTLSPIAYYKRGQYAVGGTWTDTSGNALDITQATAGKRPPVDATTFGGGTPGPFDAVNDALDIPVGVSINQRNFWIGLRFWSDGPRLDWQTNAATHWAGILDLGGLYVWNNPYWLVSLQNLAVTGAAFLRYGRLNTVILRSSASRVSLTVNDTTLTGAALSSATITGGQLGRLADDIYCSNHRYAEAIIFDGDLSDGNTATLKTYLDGIAATTPATYDATKVLLALVGDSLTTGFGSTAGQNYPTQLCASITTSIVGANLGIVGITAADIDVWAAAQAASLYDASRPANIAVIEIGVNDLIGGDSAATVYSHRKSIATKWQAAGYTVILVGLPPSSYTGTPGGYEAARQALLALEAADFPTSTAKTRVTSAAGGTTWASYRVNRESDPVMGDAGDDLNTDYYVDGLHHTNAGYARLAADVQGALVLAGLSASPAPSAPTGVVATPGDTSVSLSWDTVASVTWSIYRGTTPGGESGTAIVIGLTSATYNDTGRTNGTPYYYTVKAVNISGESAASSEVSATPAAFDWATLNLDIKFDGDAVNGKVGGGNATADNDAFATLVDGTGNGNTGTVHGTAILKTAILNGRNVIRMVAGDGYVTFPAQSVGDYTMIFVINAWDGLALLGGAGGSPQIAYGEITANKLLAYDGTNLTESTTLDPVAEHWTALMLVKSGSTVNFYQDVNARGSGPATGTLTFDRFGAVAGTSLLIHGDVAMFAMRGSAFSSGERAAAFTAIRNHWGTP